MPKAQIILVFNEESHTSKGTSVRNPPTVTWVTDIQFTLPPPGKSPCKPPKNKFDDLSFKSPNDAIKNPNDPLTPGFEFPKRRKRKIIVGKEKSISMVKGAPKPVRGLFVFHVHKETSDKDLSDYILSKGIRPLELDCLSNPDSKFKLYKLSVSLSHSKAAFNADI